MAEPWVARRRRDHWVKRAVASGYRSRSAWKLLDIQERTGILRPGRCVLELGAAPGGWSQVVIKYLGAHGLLIAVDKLEMQPLPGVSVLQGSFYDATLQDRVRTALGKREVDLVISDMSPDITGVAVIDNSAIMTLNDDTLAFSRQQPRCKACLMKSFQCEELRERIQHWRTVFDKIRILKPPASRAESRELYLLISDIQ